MRSASKRDVRLVHEHTTDWRPPRNFSSLIGYYGPRLARCYLNGRLIWEGVLRMGLCYTATLEV
jgi:hypothetical protein